MNAMAKHVAVVAVAGLALFATLGEAGSSGDSDSASTAEVSEEAVTDVEAEAEDVVEVEVPNLGLGDEARDGKFAFTVSSVECGVEKVGSEFLEEEAQGQFCLATMSIKNIGDESQIFDAGSQKGLTSTGATVDASGTASIYANEGAKSFLEKINPGNSLENIVVVYDIAKDQELVALELHDSMFSDGVLVAAQ